VVLLRVPTIVAAGGYIYLCPALAGRRGLRLRALGYDPICALVSDKDVARAVQASLHVRAAGIFNVAGNEAVPLSMLARWTGRASLPAPGPVMDWIAAGARLLGSEAVRITPSALRFGFTLDTSRAERELGFRPSDRIGLARAGDGALRVETAAL
jgi:UDP-glucose 4-epimerase